MIVEQCGGKVKQCFFSGTVWWNSRLVLVEQWNSDGGTM